MNAADLLAFTCDACAAPLTDGDVMVTLTMAEELIHGDRETEPVNLIITRTWCRACAPHYDGIERKVLASQSGGGAQDYANRGAQVGPCIEEK